MKNIFLSLFLCLLCGAPLLAQTQLPGGQNYYEDDKGYVYNREFTVDLKLLQTNGFALGVNIAQLKTYYLTRFYNIEIGEIKHVREFRQSFDYFQAGTSNEVSRAFIYGKQNNLFALRGGIGEKRYFSEKAKRRGLAVGISYEVGPSLGILKPYYLDLVRSENPTGNTSIKSEKYSAENADDFLNITRIYGGSGFGKGLSELSVIPGGHAKFALHFDWGAFDEFVKAMEAGVMVDFYFKKVPIMVDALDNVENSPIFVNFYINLQLGKRW